MVPAHIVVLTRVPAHRERQGRPARAARARRRRPGSVTAARHRERAPWSARRRRACCGVDEVGADQDFFAARRRQHPGDLAAQRAARRGPPRHGTADLHPPHRRGAGGGGEPRGRLHRGPRRRRRPAPSSGSPIVQWLGETTDAIDGFVQSVVLNTPADLTADALDADPRRRWSAGTTCCAPGWCAATAGASTSRRPDQAVAGWQESDRPLDECVALATDGLDPDERRDAARRLAPRGTATRPGRPPRGDRRRVLADPDGGPGHGLAPVRLGRADRTAPGGHVVPALDAAAGARGVRRGQRLLPASPCRARTSRWAGAPLVRGRHRRPGADSGPSRVGPEVTAALLGEIPAKFHAGVNDVLLTALAVALARWRRDLGQDQTFAHIELEGHGREDGSWRAPPASNPTCPGPSAGSPPCSR